MIDADKIKYAFYPVIGSIGASVIGALGGYDGLLEALLILMAVDFFTGTLAAAWFQKSKKTENGRLNSSVMFKGLLQKSIGLLMIVVACVLDNLTGKDDFVRNAVIIALCIREVLSFIENTTLMGYKPPEILKQALDVLYKKNLDSSVYKEEQREDEKDEDH